MNLTINFSKRLTNILSYRCFCNHVKSIGPKINATVELPCPEYDVEYICDIANKTTISKNIERRKGIGNIEKIHELIKRSASKEELAVELERIPNQTSPIVLENGEETKVMELCGKKPTFDFKPKKFEALAKNLRLMRVDNLGPLTGSRSYMFLGDLADLEEALIMYTINRLIDKQFQLISVPDILPTQIIERCGMIPGGERTQIYSLDPVYEGDQSLSGTAEMSIAASLVNAELTLDQMPSKFAAVSRCYRAEASSISEEKGLYRVHQFTKVEMFVCCEPEHSCDILNEIWSIQKDLFLNLGLHFQILDMPPRELGASAYRKLDIEGWMPGRQQYGEISSCSNCTDYQSRRLNIKYRGNDKKLKHVHTLNGTACAIPRMLIAICETYQNKDGTIKIPDNLLSFMKGKTIINRQPLADMRYAKYTPKLS